tara:strand:+ start:772 stop:1500 length:729 start_codon:yes stop_codon:yes gene_type:complete
MNIGLALAADLEKQCEVKRLYAFKYQKHGHNHMLPVLWERAHIVKTEAAVNAEMFRLRAFNDASLYPSDFNTAESCIYVVICHLQRKVCFGPRGHIIMRPKGVGLGGALMTFLIQELKDRQLGTYTIERGALWDGDATTEEDRVHRNAFYMGLGFDISDIDENTGLDVVGGQFTAANVNALLVEPHRIARLIKWRDFETDLWKAFNPPAPNSITESPLTSGLSNVLRRTAARLLGIRPGHIE